MRTLISGPFQSDVHSLLKETGRAEEHKDGKNAAARDRKGRSR